MATLITDPRIEEELIEQRRACGGDRYDEVWNGVYIMSPLANVEHQRIMSGLTIALGAALAGRAEVFARINVTDRRDDWEQNYRCPDVAVVFPDSIASDCGPYFLGGPDWVCEVASDYDRSREKFDFYAAVGVRELLLVDRNPWNVELYRLIGSELKLVGTSEPNGQQTLISEVLALTFRLLGRATGRPQIEVVKPETNDRWLV